MNIKIGIRKVEGVSVVDLTGRLVLGPETAALRETLNALLEASEKKILLNLAGLTYIDSSGLGALVAVLASATRAKAHLKLLNLDGNVHDTIRTTRLHMVFEVFNDEAKALKSFG